MSPLALSLRFLQTQSDAQLAALARAGHERAFEALVRRYRRQLLSYCRRVNSAGTNAEDTLQQALLQAWSAIRTGVEVRDPRAWLYRIVHNVAVSNQRRPVVVPIELRDTAAVNGADQEAEQRMAARDALAGLAALPDLQREVMVGTAVDGMSHDELASALGLSSGAVRGLIYRARATLRAAAAAITPGPVIAWALRSGSGPGAGVYEALAGGGSAGIGGLLVKGGVIAATAGAIATATSISTAPRSGHHRPSSAAAAVPKHRTTDRPDAAVAAMASASAVGSARVFVIDAKGPRGAASHTAFTGHAIAGGSPERRAGGGSSHDGFSSVTSGGGSGERHRRGSGSSGGSNRGDAGGTSGTGGPLSGHDGSDRGSGSSDGGTASGPAGGSTTLLTSGSGSDDHSGTFSGPDGGTPSGSDGGSSDGGSSLTTSGPAIATVSSDGGGGGSGHDGGTTTTGTTTSGTTTTTSDGGSSESRH